jgi:GrpB protein
LFKARENEFSVSSRQFRVRGVLRLASLPPADLICRKSRVATRVNHTGYSPGVTIEIRDYDPAWCDLALHAADELTGALPGRLNVVEHVGSTAVLGLAAKPVIDLMAATEALDAVTAAEDVLPPTRTLASAATGAPGRIGCGGKVAEGMLDRQDPVSGPACGVPVTS